MADDAGAGVKLPFQGAGRSIHGLEPAIHGAVKNQIPGGHQGALQSGRSSLIFQAAVLPDRIPRREFAAIPAGPWFHDDVRADERRA
ncbi:MAG: hypothetical protein WDN04_18445 [Rhodospirillales bacterium]